MEQALVVPGKMLDAFRVAGAGRFRQEVRPKFVFDLLLGLCEPFASKLQPSDHASFRAAEQRFHFA